MAQSVERQLVLEQQVERQLVLEQQVDKLKTDIDYCVRLLTDAKETLEFITQHEAFEVLEYLSSAPEVIKQIDSLLRELNN